MQIRQIEWSKKAEHQIESIFDYWDERNGSTEYTERLSKLLRKILSNIEIFPKMYSMATDDENARIANVDNFKLLYEIENNTIQILAFYDSRQDVDM